MKAWIAVRRSVLTELHLASNHRLTSLPPSIGSLSCLTTLDASGCELVSYLYL